jgi:hypothetical protein
LIAISILVFNSILFWNSNKFKKNYIRIISCLVCLLTILIFI